MNDTIYKSYVSSHGSGSQKIESTESLARRWKPWKAWFGDFLPQEPSARILDVGCGSGGFIAFLRHLGFSDVRGIDFSQEQVELAAKLGIEGVERSEALQYLESLELGSFDLIIALDVLEHIEKDNLLSFTKMVRSRLSENGLFLLRTPNGASPFGGRYRYGDLTHIQSFTEVSLAQLFSVSGFESWEFRASAPVGQGPLSFVRAFLWNFLSAGVKFYNLVELGVAPKVCTQNIIACAKR